MSIFVAVFGFVYSFFVMMTTKLGQNRDPSATRVADVTHRVSIVLLLAAIPLFAGYYTMKGIDWSLPLITLFAVIMLVHIKKMPPIERAPLKDHPRRGAISDGSSRRLHWALFLLFFGSILILLRATM